MFDISSISQSLFLATMCIREKVTYHFFEFQHPLIALIFKGI